MPFSPFFTNRPSSFPRAEAGDVAGVRLLRPNEHHVVKTVAVERPMAFRCP